jgi:ATP-dependent Clp protease ATP-binding subunit ClpA
MFERFTERARQVVVLAQEEARSLRHNYIGTEHILLGLLREEDGVAARVLTDLGLTVERARGQVVRVVGSGQDVTSGQIPFRPRAKKVMEMALREALSLGHDYIDTEHLLLALVREGEGVGARILLDFDGEPEKIRQAVRVLSGPTGWRASVRREPGAGPAAAAGSARVRRFTSQATQAVEAARREAFNLGHARIGTEHILLGLLRDGESESAQILSALGVSLEGVRAHVERVGRSTQATTAAEVPFAPQAHQALDRAQVHAANFGHGQVDTTHLLLSLTEENCVATRILIEQGAEPRKIRRQVLHALGNGAPVYVRLGPPEPGLDWHRATLLWRPEGLELRVPLRMSVAEMATFAIDPIWTQPPLAGLRREIWNGWLALASPTLLDDVCDPQELRRLLDAAAQRAVDSEGGSGATAAEFLRRLRDDP